MSKARGALQKQFDGLIVKEARDRTRAAENIRAATVLQTHPIEHHYVSSTFKTKDDMKSKLRELDLPTGGNRDVLVNRLLHYFIINRIPVG